MATRRLLLDSLVALVLLCALAVLGWFFAMPLAVATATASGLDELAVSGPMDAVRHRLALGAALGVAPILVWLVALVYRVRAQVLPSPGRVAFFFTVVLAAEVVGGGLRFIGIRSALVDAATVPGVSPMIHLGSLSLAGWATSFGVLATLALTAGVWFWERKLGDGVRP